MPRKSLAEKPEALPGSYQFAAVFPQKVWPDSLLGAVQPLLKIL